MEIALRSIDSRPAEINSRSEAGHCEIDTVKSARDTSTACLLTLTEALNLWTLRALQKNARGFFAHPYRPCERGTNENHNRMLRRFFPKGTDFSKVSAEEVAFAQNWMNSYYRKIHNGKMPLEMLRKEMGMDFALPF